MCFFFLIVCVHKNENIDVLFVFVCLLLFSLSFVGFVVNRCASRVMFDMFGFVFLQIVCKCLCAHCVDLPTSNDVIASYRCFGSWVPAQLPSLHLPTQVNL